MSALGETSERAFMRVREIRVQKGWTTQQLADAAGVSYATALAYERDNSIQARKDILLRLATALGVTVGELFT